MAASNQSLSNGGGQTGRARGPLAVLAALLVAASPLAAQANTSVLRIVPQADLRVLDPHATTATITRIHGLMIYDTLFGWDEQMNARPQMVDSVTISADGLVHDYRLRDKLTFTTGQPVRAQDVVASIQHATKQDTFLQALAQRTASIVALGDRGIRVTLKDAFPYVELALGSPGAVIMRAEDIAAAGDKPVTTLNGSGPFRFVESEHVPGARIVYERNPGYVPRSEAPNGTTGAKIVKVDRVEWTVMPDVQTRASALIRNEVDVLDQVPHDALPLLVGKKNVALVRTGLLPAFAFMRINWLSPPFNDVRARRAMASLVDQNDYLSAAFGVDPAWWQECFSFLICGTAGGSTAGSEPYQHPDPARAKALLAEAGYDGQPIRILSTQEIPLVGALAEVTADKLRRIGVNVVVETSDWSTLVARRTKTEPGAWHLTHSGLNGVETSQVVMNPLINSRCDGRNMPGWPCSETIEKLRNETIENPSPANFDALSKALWAELPTVPLGQYIQPIATRSEVSGFLRAPVLVFWNVEKR